MFKEVSLHSGSLRRRGYIFHRAGAEGCSVLAAHDHSQSGVAGHVDRFRRAYRFFPLIIRIISPS